MSQIKTFEEACAALKLDPSVLPDVSMLPEKHQKSVTAFYKLTIIAEAMNEGWQPNWKNDNEWKYFPWFDMNPEEDESGLGLSYYDYVSTASDSSVGSRLCFRTRELARQAGEQFIELYRDLFLL